MPLLCTTARNHFLWPSLQPGLASARRVLWYPCRFAAPAPCMSNQTFPEIGIPRLTVVADFGCGTGCTLDRFTRLGQAISHTGLA